MTPNRGGILFSSALNLNSDAAMRKSGYTVSRRHDIINVAPHNEEPRDSVFVASATSRENSYTFKSEDFPPNKIGIAAKKVLENFPTGHPPGPHWPPSHFPLCFTTLGLPIQRSRSHCLRRDGRDRPARRRWAHRRPTADSSLSKILTVQTCSAPRRNCPPPSFA